MKVKFGEIVDGVVRLRSNREILADLQVLGTISAIITLTNVDGTIWVEFHYESGAIV